MKSGIKIMKKEKSNHKELEVLAPARNFKFAKEAIKCGADAVYMGANTFGLRYGFGNDIKEIEKTVKFAHKYWAKVYVTVNTLIFKDEDFTEVKSLIEKLYKIGVDAIIIQDMGILELDLPPIPLHASTTTSCFSPEKVDFLEKVGIERVILPRELSLKEIKEIKAKTNVDLESFVHGLLCVGYSGKCYMNFSKNLKCTNKSNPIDYYQKFGASNGKCNMNCMHSYSLLDADKNIIVENERLLNLPFLNLLGQLDEIVDAGITSFKIEGRHKELSYIKNIVSLFREKTDEIINEKNYKKASSGKVIRPFVPSLEKTFNKGFTDFFLYGRKQEMYGKNKIVGEFVGNVTKITNNSFSLDSDVALAKGDKLRFKDENATVKNIDIEKTKNKTFFTTGTESIKEGTPIYRYLNKKAVDEIEKTNVTRVIPIEVEIKETNGKLIVNAVDEDLNKTQIETDSAKSNDFTKKEAETFLKKQDHSEFLIEKTTIQTENMPSRESLLKIKKAIFSKLRKARKVNRPRLLTSIEKNSYPYPDKKITYLDNVVNPKAEEFFKRHGVKEIEPGFEASFNLEGKNALTGKYCIKNELNLCPKQNKNSNIKEPLYLMDDHENTFELRFDCKKCEMNVIF